MRTTGKRGGIAVAAVSAGLWAGASLPAQATAVDFSGYDPNLGVVAAGQTGSLIGGIELVQNQSSATVTQSQAANGVLPADTRIVFSITVSNSLGGSGSIYGDGYAWNYDGQGSYKTIYVGADTQGGGYRYASAYNAVTGTWSSIAPLLDATASVSQDGERITLTLANLSSNSAYFSEYVNNLVSLGNSGAGMAVSYAVSAVPLPSSMPLFILAVAGCGLAGLRLSRGPGKIE